jgi:ribosomal protein L11 methyltransferase
LIFLLEISLASDVEDVVQGRLFLTRSTGNVSTREGVISAYFDSASDRQAAADALRDLPVGLTLLEQERVDWLEQYRQSLHPLLIGDSFVIAPEASLLDRSRPHHLVIPQEQAFGTGSHESTALSIELLEMLQLRGKRALDIGSGSGILGLAMSRLGARNIIAFDIDPEAFRPLRENRRRNGVLNMSVFIGGLESIRDRRFDVITMNILPEIIIPLLPQVKECLAGDLILSGILTRMRPDVVGECAIEGLELVRDRTKGEWWAGSFRLTALR